MSYFSKELMSMFFKKIFFYSLIIFSSFLYYYHNLEVTNSFVNFYFNISMIFFFLILNYNFSLNGIAEYCLVIKILNILFCFVLGLYLALYYILYGFILVQVVCLAGIVNMFALIQLQRQKKPFNIYMIMYGLKMVLLLYIFPLSFSLIYKQILSFMYILCLFGLTHYYYYKTNKLVKNGANMFDGVSDYLVYNILLIFHVSIINFLNFF